jgi:LemA protein
VKIALIAIAVLVLMLLFMGGKYVSVRNDLATQQEAVRRQWSDVEGVLQRRADLIPNLVSTVKAFAAHETEVY